MNVNTTRAEYNKSWRSIMVKEQNLEEYIDFINNNQIEAVYIVDGAYKMKDIDFLKDCPSIREVNLNSQYVEDVEALYQLPHLQSLIFNEANGKLDLQNLKSLESLGADFRDVENIKCLENLRKLYLINFNQANSGFLELENLQNLEEVSLIFSNLISLKGISHLSKLAKLEISDYKKLVDISELGQLSNCLKELRIDDSKRIEDYSCIGKLHNLESLALCDDGRIQSIQFIEELEKLESFIFVGTTVDDGEVLCCKRLKHVEFDNKKHYTGKNSQFNKQYN